MLGFVFDNSLETRSYFYVILAAASSIINNVHPVTINIQRGLDGKRYNLFAVILAKYRFRNEVIIGSGWKSNALTNTLDTRLNVSIDE